MRSYILRSLITALFRLVMISIVTFSLMQLGMVSDDLLEPYIILVGDESQETMRLVR